MTKEEVEKINRIIDQLLEANLQVKALSFFLKSIGELDNPSEEETYKGVGGILFRIERQITKATNELMDSKG